MMFCIRALTVEFWEDRQKLALPDSRSRLRALRHLLLFLKPAAPVHFSQAMWAVFEHGAIVRKSSKPSVLDSGQPANLPRCCRLQHTTERWSCVQVGTYGWKGVWWGGLWPRCSELTVGELKQMLCFLTRAYINHIVHDSSATRSLDRNSQCKPRETWLSLQRPLWSTTQSLCRSSWWRCPLTSSISSSNVAVWRRRNDWHGNPSIVFWHCARFQYAWQAQFRAEEDWGHAALAKH